MKLAIASARGWGDLAKKVRSGATGKIVKRLTRALLFWES